MSDLIPDESFVNSIVGEGTRFKGEFDLDGLLRIDGDFTGVVRTKGRVLVGRSGRAECTIYAATVVIGGALRGDVHATEKVIILSTALVLGNVSTPRMVVEEGVAFSGNCVVHPEAVTRSVAPGRPDGSRPATLVTERQSPSPGAARAEPTDDARFRPPADTVTGGADTPRPAPTATDATSDAGAAGAAGLNEDRQVTAS